MKATEILMLGIGQAGNNIVDEIAKQNRRIRAICINSSKHDMEPLTHVKEKVVLPAAGGAGRDRETAKKYLKDEIFLITDVIEEYSSLKYVHIAFSLGGGTGSGITPLLLQVLSKTYQGRKFNLIGVLPHVDEGRKAQENAIACWKELMAIKESKNSNIGAFYLLDNNKRPYKNTINREFATLFNKFLDITKAHTDGVIDATELTKLANTEGLCAIYDMNKYIDSLDVSLDDYMKDSIFVTGSTSVACLGISTPKGFDKKPIINHIAAYKDTFEGVSEDNPLMVLSGVNMTNKAVEHTYETLKYKTDILELNREEAEKETDINLDIVIEKSKPVETVIETKSIDDLLGDGDEDSFWDDIMNM